MNNMVLNNIDKANDESKVSANFLVNMTALLDGKKTIKHPNFACLGKT